MNNTPTHQRDIFFGLNYRYDIGRETCLGKLTDYSFSGQDKSPYNNYDFIRDYSHCCLMPEINETDWTLY